jgi:hypothetical protein
MKRVVLILALATVATTCLGASEPTPSGQQQQQQQQQQPAAPAAAPAPIGATSSVASHSKQAQATNTERQGRSISSSGNAGNSLLNNGNLNVIEHSSSKSRLEQEKRAVQEFLTTKNIFKSIMKLLFGNQDEISATSRNVLGVLSKVLDLLKNTFGQKSRSGTARTIRDSAEDAASAGVSMLQGYVKSVLANDGHCAKRYLCQASREAIRDGRDLGYVIATVGGYATSYLLDSSRSNGFNTYYDASLKGRSAKDDCAKLYAECSE